MKKNQLLCTTAFLCLSAMCLFAAQTDIDSDLTHTPKFVGIPHVKSWKEVDGARYHLHDQSVIYFSNPSLEPLAQMFAEEIFVTTGVYAKSAYEKTYNPKKHHIFLELTKVPAADLRNAHFRQDAYELAIGKGIRISAQDVPGIHYGTRTLLQQIRQSGASLPCGRAVDYPSIKERSLMLDLAGKYLSVEFLEDLIRQMSYFKYNTLHLKFANDSTFRLESQTVRGITANQFYSYDDITRLVSVAKKNQVTIIPEIPVLTHVGVFGKYNPKFVMHNEKIGSACGAMLDITKEESVDFAFQLVDEYSALFNTPYFHIGGRDLPPEEALCSSIPLVNASIKNGQVFANPEDPLHPYICPTNLLMGFVNELNDRLRKTGKTMRMWNGWNRFSLGEHPPAETVLPSANIIQEVEGGIDPASLFSQGYTIVNSTASMDSVAEWLSLDDNHSLYQWSPNQFDQHGDGAMTALPHSKVLGGQFEVNIDEMQYDNEQLLGHMLSRPLRIVGNALWTGKTSDLSFNHMMKNCSQVGGAPSLDTTDNYEWRFIAYDDQPCFDGQSGKEQLLKLGTMPTPWTLSFWYSGKVSETGENGAPLLLSKMSKLYLSLSDETPNIGFSLAKEVVGAAEDAYFPFDYVLPENRWTHVSLVGSQGGVELFINGEKVDEIHSMIPLPADQLGDKEHPFEGLVRDVRIYSHAIWKDDIHKLMKNRWIEEQEGVRNANSLNSYSETLFALNEEEGVVELETFDDEMVVEGDDEDEESIFTD